MRHILRELNQLYRKVNSQLIEWKKNNKYKTRELKKTSEEVSISYTITGAIKAVTKVINNIPSDYCMSMSPLGKLCIERASCSSSNIIGQSNNSNKITSSASTTKRPRCSADTSTAQYNGTNIPSKSFVRVKDNKNRTIKPIRFRGLSAPSNSSNSISLVSVSSVSQTRSLYSTR